MSESDGMTKSTGESPSNVADESFSEKIELLENAEAWTNKRMKDVGYNVEPNRNLRSGDKIYSKKQALDLMFLEYSRQFRAFNRLLPKTEKIYPATKDLIAIALDKVIDDAWKLHLGIINEQLSFKANASLNPLSDFVSACASESSELNIYVLAHWIWQVKRKMRSLPVSNHLMLVLFGKQGSGKSTAVDLLLRPIAPYKSDMAISALADERNYHTLQENFVVVCDEMHGCAKTDIEHLKQIITASTISARVLYTNSRDKIPQGCTLIGTSNKSIDSIIRDDTGMRRFFCLDCKDKIDWKTVNEIDPLEIWRCVDENKLDGYLPRVFDKLGEAQESYRHKDSVETYLEETRASSDDRSQLVPISEIYSDYKEWCDDAGFKAVDRNYFGKQLKRFKFDSRRTSSARYVVVSAIYSTWSSLRSGPFNDPERQKLTNELRAKTS